MPWNPTNQPNQPTQVKWPKKAIYIKRKVCQNKDYALNERGWIFPQVCVKGSFVYCCIFFKEINCSSYRSVPPPSDSATHWPISGQSALIPSSSKELFFSSPFWMSPQNREYPASKEKDLSLVLFHWTLQRWRSSSKITAATCNTLLLPATLLRPATHKELFSLWHKSTFSHKNKPFVVNFQKSFVILFTPYINNCKLIYSIYEPNIY